MGLPYRVPEPLRVIAFLLFVIGFLLINAIVKKKGKNQFVKGKIVYLAVPHCLEYL